MQGDRQISKGGSLPQITSRSEGTRRRKKSTQYSINDSNSHSLRAAKQSERKCNYMKLGMERRSKNRDYKQKSQTGALFLHLKCGLKNKEFFLSHLTVVFVFSLHLPCLSPSPFFRICSSKLKKKKNDI